MAKFSFIGLTPVLYAKEEIIFDKSATFLGWENNTSFPTSNAKPYRGKDIPCNHAHSIDNLPFVDQTN